jgi:hypothetical protein
MIDIFITFIGNTNACAVQMWYMLIADTPFPSTKTTIHNNQICSVIEIVITSKEAHT